MSTKPRSNGYNKTHPVQVGVRLTLAEREYVRTVAVDQNMTLRELLLDAVNRYAKDLE